MIHKLLALLALCAVLSVGCSPLAAPTLSNTLQPTQSPSPSPSPQPSRTPTLVPSVTPSPVPAYPDLSVSMSVGGGWSLLWTQVEIDGYGNVSHEDRIGPNKQRGSAKITPQQVEELVTAINKSGIWELEDGDVGRTFCTDVATVSISITLNGLSKHVSYLGCGSDSASQALLDLQDLIEALGQLAIPTPTPPPPTRTPPAIMKAGDFGILSQRSCGPPCFLGIRPGVTTIEEASGIMQDADLPCKEDDAQHVQELTCESGDVSVIVRASGLCTAGNGENLVGGIGLRPPSKITLGQFVAKYGPPDALMMRWPQATASYENLQTFLFVPLPPGQQTYALTADTIIDEVAYVTAAEYAECLDMSENNRQTWRGFGTYAPNAGP